MTRREATISALCVFVVALVVRIPKLDLGSPLSGVTPDSLASGRVYVIGCP